MSVWVYGNHREPLDRYNQVNRINIHKICSNKCLSFASRFCESRFVWTNKPNIMFVWVHPSVHTQIWMSVSVWVWVFGLISALLFSFCLLINAIYAQFLVLNHRMIYRIVWKTFSMLDNTFILQIKCIKNSNTCGSNSCPKQ